MPSTLDSSPAREDKRMTGMALVSGLARVLAQKPDAVRAGHHDVLQDQVGRVGADGRQRRATICCGLDIRVANEQTPDVIAHVGVVISQQHPRPLPGRSSTIGFSTYSRAIE